MTTSHTSPAGPSRPTMTARKPEDLLAMVPVVLGFQPHDSIVMLTFGAPQAFHARIDLPRTGADLAETVTALVRPAARHGVRSVVLVVYAPARDRPVARRAGRALVRGLDDVGILVLEVLVTDGERWSPLLAGAPAGTPADGVPYDLTAHPFTARAVFEGRALLGSRDELAEGLVPDAAAQAALATALRGSRPVDREGAVAVVARHLGAGAVPDAQLAGLLLGIRDVRVRDAAWGLVTRSTARDHVALWSDAARRAPDDLAGGAAAVLAFAAWAAGHGALAWCALDRCHEVDPANSLAALVGDLLQQAVPPTWWEEARAEVVRGR